MDLHNCKPRHNICVEVTCKAYLRCDICKIASPCNPYHCGCVQYFAMLGMLAGSFMPLLPYLLLCSAILPADLLSSPTCYLAQQSYLMFCSAVELVQLQGSLVCQLHQYESPVSLQAYRPYRGRANGHAPKCQGSCCLVALC